MIVMIEAVTKMNDCFTICQYKAEKPENIEISAPISLAIWRFCWETGMLSLDPKWLSFKLKIKSTGLLSFTQAFLLVT